MQKDLYRQGIAAFGGIVARYVKNSILKIEKLPNGRYEYDTESIYNFLNKDLKRKTYIYARVSTPKQKAGLNNQVDLPKQANGQDMLN